MVRKKMISNIIDNQLTINQTTSETSERSLYKKRNKVPCNLMRN